MGVLGAAWVKVIGDWRKLCNEMLHDHNVIWINRWRRWNRKCRQQAKCVWSFGSKTWRNEILWENYGQTAG